MTLDQPNFYIFLIAIAGLCWKLPSEKRWIALLTANIIFLFALNSSIAWIFLAVALMNFFITRLKGYEKFPFYLAASVNLSFLFFYRYLKYFLPETSGLVKYLILPAGISFFVFQQLSYLIDVRRRKSMQIENLWHYLTYSFLFANFTTGPIERANKIVPQFQAICFPTKDKMRAAAVLIFWGLFKKMAVADNITPFVEKVFALHAIYTHHDVLPAVLLNKYEIYANFSGYTDIALGMGILLGIKFTENFRRPFSALTIVDYWKRWHLSLSYWIRDYVFFPLSTSKLSRLGIYPIMIVTFLVFSLWHDLRVSYLIYPFIQVFLIFLSIKFKPVIDFLEKRYPSKKIWGAVNFFRRIWVYIVLVSLPNIFFRAETLSEVGRIFHSLIILNFSDYTYFFLSLFGSCFLVFSLVAGTEFVEWFKEKKNISDWLAKQSYFVEVSCYLLALLLFLSLAKFGSNTGFVYSKY